ncbi:MAG: OmpA family protein [Saprospiraceae bacterium]
MKGSFYKIPPTLLIFSIFLFGCVSKKKHLAAIQTMKTTNEGIVDDWQKRYNEKQEELNASEEKGRQLELNLAERKGENNILVGLRNELQLQIETMESQMTSLGSSSQTAENNFRNDIKTKKNKIDALQKKLEDVDGVFEKNKKMLEQISGNLAFEFQSMNLNSVEVTTRMDKVVLIIPTDLLFRKKSTTRIISSGNALLEKASNILNRHPQVVIQVVGHTDNSSPSSKKFLDNWNYSSLQAATLARSLVSDYDMNASQLSAIGKGEFEPRTSNSTQEGKSMNRRIEFVIFQPTEDLAKEIRRIIGESKS